jgi:hypothetical protein
MLSKIGFAVNSPEERTELQNMNQERTIVPRKSVVEVYFPDRQMTLSYFNDKFDLLVNDVVFVDGKLEGLRGIVRSINYDFKIKLSEYKKVIRVADTDVKGELYITPYRYVSFDKNTLNYEKVSSWFVCKNDEDYEVGGSDKSFPLNDLSEMNIQSHIAERGHDYYINNNVVFLELDGNKGRAIVEGSNVYDVEFNYENGMVSNLVCDCFCPYACKHQFAVMLQLRECLEDVEKLYKKEYESSHYFASIFKQTLHIFAINNKQSGKLVLD